MGVGARARSRQALPSAYREARRGEVCSLAEARAIAGRAVARATEGTRRAAAADAHAECLGARFNGAAGGDTGCTGRCGVRIRAIVALYVRSPPRWRLHLRRPGRAGLGRHCVTVGMAGPGRQDAKAADGHVAPGRSARRCPALP